MRLLIIRTSALGDIVHALPVLTALRRHLPEARVGWVVEASMLPLLQDHPDIDVRIPVKLRGWRRALGRAATWREMRAAVRAMREFHADAVLDLMGNHKAGTLAWLSGCPRRIGLARPFRREPSSALWINETVRPRGEHAVDQVLGVLDALQIPPVDVDFGAERIMTTEPPAVQQLLDAHPEPFALIPPGAGWGNKVYPARWWGTVARQIHQQTGIRVWVPCGPGEQELAAELAAASQGAARDLGLIDLPTLAGLMRRARLVLGGDSGPLHLAHALGAPVLCVLGPTDPRRHGPYGEPRRALARPLPCSYCYKRYEEAKACLLGIPPAVVVERALELLTRTSH